MDDFLEAARNGINGTVADFSKWKGVKEGEFKHMGMKINSSEKVIEPVENEEFDEQVSVPEMNKKPEVELPPQPQFRDEPARKPEPQQQETVEMPDRPGTQQAYLNPNELKSIAVKLMPTVDKLMHNIHEQLDRNTMRHISETAINMAFEFLQVWNEKVSVE